LELVTKVYKRVERVHSSSLDNSSQRYCVNCSRARTLSVCPVLQEDGRLSWPWWLVGYIPRWFACMTALTLHRQAC